MGMLILLAIPQNTLRLELKATYSKLTSNCNIREAATSQDFDNLLLICPWDLAVVHQSLITDITKLPKDHFVVITNTPDSGVFLASLAHGSRGYLLEESVTNNHLLMAALLIQGALFIDSELSKWLSNCIELAQRAGFHELLTPREQEIFNMTGLGFTSKMIAERLCISMSTVKKHREHIAHKLRGKYANPT